jgi:hypothetical protein
MMPGPCQGCGSTNYQLSNGGPAWCPECDVKAAAELDKLQAAQWQHWRGQKPNVARGPKYPGMLEPIF